MKKYLYLFLSCASLLAQAQESRQLAVDKPQAIADLRTNEGAALVNGKWYIQPAYIQQADFRSPGASVTDAMPLYPTGMPIKTHTLYPQVGTAGFDSAFREIRPTDLEMREGMGLISFVWFKTQLTIPANIGKLNTSGSTAIFEIVMDAYSEIWVNGKQMDGFGQNGEGPISGYNSRNRVILTENA